MYLVGFVLWIINGWDKLMEKFSIFRRKIYFAEDKCYYLVWKLLGEGLIEYRQRILTNGNVKF